MTINKILVLGASGFVGSVLTPQLLAAGYQVRALDMMYFGETLQPHPSLEIIKGDFRSSGLMARAMKGIDAVIHLACLSNDPCAELAPSLTESEYRALAPMLLIARRAGVQRFVYASSSSVYGTKSETDVVETLPLEPITTYSRYKAKSEDVVLGCSRFLEVIVLRPATVCGYSPRLRLDVIVNLLTAQGYFAKSLRVEGGAQFRAHLHIADMARCYVEALGWGSHVCGQVFNVGAQNMTVGELAELVAQKTGAAINVVPNDKDLRSYRLNSDKLKTLTGFAPRFTVSESVTDLVTAFVEGKAPDALTDSKHYNIRRMKEILAK